MSDVLFGNNNKAVIKKVANRNFHSNKKRNILAVIAIALTTFLLTAVLTIGFGAKNILQYSEARLLGSQADALVQGMTKEQAEQLKENAMFEKAGIQIGIAFLENTKQLNVELDYADETLMEVCFMTPNIGTIPKAENEVLVSANVLEDLGIPQKAGETLPVDLKVDGKIEHFDMKVSGIYEPVKNDVGYVMVSKTFLEEQEEMISTLRKDRENRNYYNAHVILKDPSMVEERIGEFIRSIGGNPDDREAENYVRIAPTPSATQSDGNLVVWLAAGVFGILFMFGGYLLIYNVFDMSVTNDVRQYGLLRTIGTTPKQVKGLVRKQAMYLFLIGTPIGVLLGILLGKGMLPAVLQMFVAELGEKNVVVGSLPYLPIIIGSVIFSALTVWISTRKSAKKASRVSPIEAVRYVEHSTGKIRERKHVKGALLPRMAKANVQRNKGRMVLVIVSLMLSIILLNSVFVFVGSVDEDIYVERKMRSDFAVYTAQAGVMQKGFTGHSAALPENVAEAVTQRPGVKNVTKMYRNTYDDNHISCDWGIPYEIDNTNKGYFPSTPEKFNRGVYRDEEGNSHYAALNPDNRPLGMITGEYVIIGYTMDRSTEEPNSTPMTDELQVGDRISFFKDGELVKTCTILAKAIMVGTELETPMGTSAQMNIGGDAPFVYISDNAFKQIYDVPTLLSYGFNVDKTMQAQMEEFLNDYKENDSSVAYTSTKLLKEQMYAQRDILLIVGGMIGAIMAFAGLINFTNMMVTNIITRRHEFAAMQSIGMTNRQLRRLIMDEGLYYAAGADVIGGLLAAILGVTVLKNVLNSPSMWYFTLRFTLVPALFIAVIYLILAAIIPVVVLHFFNKGSVVERLRTE